VIAALLFAATCSWQARSANPTVAPAAAPQVCRCASESASATPSFFNSMFPALISLVGSLVGVGLVVYFTRRNVIAEHWLKTNEAQANYIQEKLDKFYGPFIIISESNHLIAQDLRARQPNSAAYRLLDKLFDSKWKSTLSLGDSVFVAEICATGEKLDELVQKQAGLVATEILPYIARAMTHYRVLSWAHKDLLGSDSKPYLRYVYPKVLDRVVDLELRRLTQRLTLLREHPSKPHGSMPPLDLAQYPLEKWPDPQRPDFVEGEGLVVDPRPGASLRESLTKGGPTDID
jgi:hypothetical protein